MKSDLHILYAAGYPINLKIKYQKYFNFKCKEHEDGILFYLDAHDQLEIKDILLHKENTTYQNEIKQEMID